MSKRSAEDQDDLKSPLKKGARPVTSGAEKNGDDADEDFEDEFEDEFESENEIFEAGVDGRPDAERQAEETGTWNMPYR